jgi:hypothetical protein
MQMMDLEDHDEGDDHGEGDEGEESDDGMDEMEWEYYQEQREAYLRALPKEILKQVHAPYCIRHAKQDTTDPSLFLVEIGFPYHVVSLHYSLLYAALQGRGVESEANDQLYDQHGNRWSTT